MELTYHSLFGIIGSNHGKRNPRFGLRDLLPSSQTFGQLINPCIVTPQALRDLLAPKPIYMTKTTFACFCEMGIGFHGQTARIHYSCFTAETKQTISKPGGNRSTMNDALKKCSIQFPLKYRCFREKKNWAQQSRTLNLSKV